MKYSILLSVLIGLNFCVYSQNKSVQKTPLSLGDKVPNLQFTNMLNYHAPTAQLSDFKGKLIILDLWATWCKPCLSALPKMQALQQQFNGKIQILAITGEDKKHIEAFFKKTNGTKELPLIPIITNGNQITKHFKFTAIPHEIWIGADGKIKAITSEQYVNAQNITAILNNTTVNWPVKDNEEKLNANMALYTPSEKATGIKFHSGFTSYISGMSSVVKTTTDTANKTKRYNIYNYSILALYSLLYNKLPQFENPKLCVLNVTDSSRLLYNKHTQYRDVWNTKNLYAYEAVFPAYYTEKDIYNKLKNDIDFYFMLNAKLEKRKIKCLILKQLNMPIQSSNDSTENGLATHKLIIDDNYNYNYSQKNTYLQSFVQTINKDPWAYKLPLMIDETGNKKKHSFEIRMGQQIENINEWAKQLNKYGFELILEEREIEMLVLSDKDKKSNLIEK